jgi:hypothetical protein
MRQYYSSISITGRPPILPRNEKVLCRSLLIREMIFMNVSRHQRCPQGTPASYPVVLGGPNATRDHRGVEPHHGGGQTDLPGVANDFGLGAYDVLLEVREHGLIFGQTRRHLRRGFKSSARPLSRESERRVENWWRWYAQQ